MPNRKAFQMVLVGCGAMGGALARGWLVTDLKFDLTIVTPSRHSLQDLPNAKSVRWYPSYQTYPVGQEPDVIVLAVKPHILEQVLPKIPLAHLKSAVIVSVAAGKELASYYKFVPEKTALVKVMPNLPIAFHAGMSIGFASKNCLPEQIRLVERLFNALGQFMWLKDEKHFHPATVVSGSGPAYVYLLEEAMVNAGEKIGLSKEDAGRLARQTIIGAAKSLMYQNPTTTTALKNKVTSPGGVTAAARAVLEQPYIGLPSLFVRAFQEAVNKSYELSRG